MKTFTLRMNDNEAAALDRMAACYGMSKNKFLTTVIAAEYSKMRLFGKKPDDSEYVTGFLYFFDDLKNFPENIRENYDSFFNNKHHTEEPEISQKECALRVLSAYDYALENVEDPAEFEKIEGSKNEFLDEIGNTLIM